MTQTPAWLEAAARIYAASCQNPKTDYRDCLAYFGRYQGRASLTLSTAFRETGADDLAAALEETLVLARLIGTDSVIARAQLALAKYRAIKGK